MLDRQQIKQTIKLGWPISLQNILVTLLSMIDVVMVSHLGDGAIAAVGLGNRVIFVLMVIILGLGWAVGILSAQYHGAGQSKKIRRSILIGVTCGLTAITPIVVASYFLSDDVLRLGTSDKGVIDVGEQYLWITVPSLLFVAVIMVFENALRSMNSVKLPLVLSSVAIAINIVLNFWLINGGAGIEPMGVAGAAWATTISRLLQMLMLLVVIQKSNLSIAIKRTDILYLKKIKDWNKFVKLALPMMFSFGIWSVGSFCYQLIYGQMGTNELAVISMLLPVEGIFLSLFFGIASACSISVGQHLGANRMEDAWATAKTFNLLAPIVAIAVGLIALNLRDIILMPYEGVSTTTLLMAYEVFVVVALCSWLKVINMTLALGVLRAGGDNRFVLMTDIIGMWLVSLPLTYLAAFYWEWAIVFVALTAYSEELAKGVLFGYRVMSKKWMRNLT